MASPNRDEIGRLELLHAAHPRGLIFPHLADAYRRAGRLVQAEAVLQAGLRQHTDYASAYVVLARVHMDQGRVDDAEQAFRRVLELDPENQVALEQLAHMAVTKGGPDPEARIGEPERRAVPANGGNGTFRMEAERNGHSPEARSTGTPEVETETVAELYARQGLYASAAGIYRKLLERSPEDPRLRARLAAVEREAWDGPDTTAAAAPGSASPSATPERAIPPATPERPSPSVTPDPPPAPVSGPDQAFAIREHLETLLGWRPKAPVAGVPPADDAGGGVPPFAKRRLRAVAESGDSAPPPPRASQTTLADLLVGLLEYRDPFFRGGSSLTRILATAVAEELGLPEAAQHDLALSAPLRDLARLAVGGRLIPAVHRGPTQEEQRRIEQHVDLTLHLLDGVELPGAVRQAIRHHHERWDGDGYPDGLAGEEIPVLARVLAATDSFVAMISPRPYRLPLELDEAQEELRAGASLQYDPAVVEALLTVLGRRDPPRLDSPGHHQILLVSPFRAEAVATAVKLCSAGYLAEVAADLDRARERLRRGQVAGVLLWATEGGDWALSLIQELRRERELETLPILVLNAAAAELRVRLLESGADVCFPPGVRHAELQGTLAALTRRLARPR